MDTIADLQRVPEMLKKRGYSGADIEGSCTATGCGSSGRRGAKGNCNGHGADGAPGGSVTWRAARLPGQRGYSVQLRMIDGELAFPDEVPPETWRELRVGTPQGMLTLRRDEEALTVVTGATPRQSCGRHGMRWYGRARGRGRSVETERGGS